jgi:hypothetical protein
MTTKLNFYALYLCRKPWRVVQLPLASRVHQHSYDGELGERDQKLRLRRDPTAARIGAEK